MQDFVHQQEYIEIPLPLSTKEMLEQCADASFLRRCHGDFNIEAVRITTTVFFFWGGPY